MWPFNRKKTKQEVADKVAASARADEQQKARKLAMRRAVMKSMSGGPVTLPPSGRRPSSCPGWCR